MATIEKDSSVAGAAPPAWGDYAHVGPGTLAGRYLRRFWQPVPRVSSVETEYGTCETVTFSDRFGYVHRIMPNTRLFTVPTPSGGWTEFMLWLVPVDDEHHMGFGVLMHHVTDPERFAASRFNDRRQRETKEPTPDYHG